MALKKVVAIEGNNERSAPEDPSTHKESVRRGLGEVNPREVISKNDFKKGGKRQCEWGTLGSMSRGGF